MCTVPLSSMLPDRGDIWLSLPMWLSDLVGPVRATDCSIIRRSVCEIEDFDTCSDDHIVINPASQPIWLLCLGLPVYLSPCPVWFMPPIRGASGSQYSQICVPCRRACRQLRRRFTERSKNLLGSSPATSPCPSPLLRYPEFRSISLRNKVVAESNF